MEKNFELAIIGKYRFASEKGNLTMEDLYDLKLNELDPIAKSLNRKIKNSEEESFIVKKSTANKKLLVSFEIVKHIIEVKLAEKEKLKAAASVKIRKAQLAEKIAVKEGQVDDGKTLDELKDELDNM